MCMRRTSARNALMKKAGFSSHREKHRRIPRPRSRWREPSDPRTGRPVVSLCHGDMGDHRHLAAVNKGQPALVDSMVARTALSAEATDACSGMGT